MGCAFWASSHFCCPLLESPQFIHIVLKVQRSQPDAVLQMKLCQIKYSGITTSPALGTWLLIILPRMGVTAFVTASDVLRCTFWSAVTPDPFPTCCSLASYSPQVWFFFQKSSTLHLSLCPFIQLLEQFLQCVSLTWTVSAMCGGCFEFWSCSP